MSFDVDLGVDFTTLAIGLVVIYLVFWGFRKARQVSSAKAHLLVDTGALLLDVRTKQEFESGHLPGAVNIPLPMLTADPAQVGNDKQRPIVVYCASGTRSAVASVVLGRFGYAQVADLGPMKRW